MRKRRDMRIPITLAVVVTVCVLGLFSQWVPARGVAVSVEAAPAEPVFAEGRGSEAVDVHREELDRRFEQAVVMLHAKQYEYALVALERVIALRPTMPEAHVNLGYALIGLEEWQRAAQSFEAAIDLRPTQENAYYGLAIALQGADDLPGARGAMRAFIHLTEADDPFVRKARAALWEWEATQERADELSRDDRAREERG